MKKIYTLLAMAFCVYSAGAGAAERSAVNGLRSNLEEQKMAKKETSAKAATRADENWKSIGKGIYREGLVSSFIKGLDPQDIEVEIEQNVNDETCYRIVNPYENWENPFADVEYDASGEYYINFNIVDYQGKKVWYINGDSNLGLIWPQISDGVMGMMSIMAFGDQAYQYGVDAFAEYFGESSLGVYREGLLTYPYDMTFVGSDKEVVTQANIWVHFSSQQSGYGFMVNQKGNFAIAMPGVEMKDYDPFEGYTLVGECDSQDNLFDNYFREWETPQGKSVVYENPLNKGEFHIKNFFVAGGWQSEETAKLFDFEINLSDPNYGTIDWIEDVYNDVEYGTTSIMSSSTFYTRYIADAKEKLTKAQFLAQHPEMNIYIDADTKRIMLPIQSVGFLFPDAPETSEVYSAITWAATEAPAAASWIQLPSDYVLPNSGVNTIAADDVNAPVKYYNLQGMEVANPEAGQLVIMKKGSKASKFIAK
ncbi:MAG: hypothetical protein K2M39_10310 [Muribaculaceae bacterium]|nr:hypothetical protein [Muribaculaceae bacterium]